MNSVDRRDYLACAYFNLDVVWVARDLIGRTLVVHDKHQSLEATIFETEAYGGSEDPASHAAFRPGGRAQVMFGEPGLTYVYAAYGMYPCFNIVCGEVGSPAAVLVRGAWIVGDQSPTFGPGRLTRRLGISLDDHGASIGSGRFDVSVTKAAARVDVTTRIGIRRGVDLPWRFCAPPVTDEAEREQ